MLTEKPLNLDQEGVKKQAFSAALTPLEDLGLRQRKIPEMLKMLADDPYTPPDAIACENIKQEMADLTVLLGPDVDTPQMALSAQDQMMETGGNLVTDAVVGLVRNQVSIIPFRSVVRRLTGAQSHEKAVSRAVEAGKLRRAYLRGLADAKFGYHCIPKVKIITATADEKKPDPGVEIAGK